MPKFIINNFLNYDALITLKIQNQGLDSIERKKLGALDYKILISKKWKKNEEIS